jgi:hypothetical protein
MDKDPESHKLTLGLVPIDGELPTQSVLIDMRFFDLHL